MTISETLKNKFEKEKNFYVANRSSRLRQGVVTDILKTIEKQHNLNTPEEYWRTKFKFYNECCICGSTESIELHHINSLKSIKNKEKDHGKVIRSQINRIQISVSRPCHEDITHGR